MSAGRPYRLSRRDLLRLSSAASVSLLLSACSGALQVAQVYTPVANPTLSSAIPPSATEMPTTIYATMPVATPPSPALPEPTNTPTPKKTVTWTPTNTPIPTGTATLAPPTKTPEPTKTPTETPSPIETPKIRQIIFQDDFNNGIFNNGVASRFHWNEPSLNEKGAKVDIVRDPTNSKDSDGKPRGFVMRTTTQKPVNNLQGWTPGYWQAGYPGWIYFDPTGGTVNNVRETAGTSVDVWVDPNIQHASLLGVHRINLRTGTANSVAALEKHNGKITVLGRKDGGKDVRVDCIDGLYKNGEWNSLMFSIDIRTGRVLPFINGVFGLKSVNDAPVVNVDADTPGSFSDAHGGINFNMPLENQMIPEGLNVLNDNFRVFTVAWQQ